MRLRTEQFFWNIMGAKTPVSILQEMMVRMGSPPKYDLLFDGSGTHATLFKYRVYAGDLTAIGCGRSKKEAKHEAARLALEQIAKRQIQPPGAEALPPEEAVATPYKDKLEENAVGALHDLCAFNEIPIPEYGLVDEKGPPHAKTFTYTCSVSKQKEIGVGRTKKQAKQLAANNMIKRLKASLGDVLTDGRSENFFQPEGENLDHALTKYVTVTGVTRKKISLKRTPYTYHDFFVETPIDVRKSVWEELTKTPLPSSTLEAKNCDVDWLSRLKKVIECLDAQAAIVPGKSATNGSETAFVLLNLPVEAVFFGSGDSHEAAVQEAAVRALLFLKIQLQNPGKKSPEKPV